MIDNFSLALIHGLLLVATWRFLTLAGRDPEENADAKNWTDT